MNNVFFCSIFFRLFLCFLNKNVSLKMNLLCQIAMSLLSKMSIPAISQKFDLGIVIYFSKIRNIRRTDSSCILRNKNN